MRIDESKLLAMYTIANVSRPRLLSVLRAMGREHLSHKNMEWSESNPTRNYCYVVSEWVHRFCLLDSKPMGVAIPGDEYKHRYLIASSGSIVDLTCDQFRDYSLVRYELGRPTPFMRTGGPQPSKRAQLVEHLYRGGSFASFVYKREH